MKILKNKKGEGYVDVAVTVMIVAFVLVFMVNEVSLVALNQNLKTAADQLSEYASANGTTAIDSYATEISEKLGVEFTYSFAESELMDASGKVQLGDKIQCTVTHHLNFLGFGEAEHALTVKASASGISRVYWK